MLNFSIYLYLLMVVVIDIVDRYRFQGYHVKKESSYRSNLCRLSRAFSNLVFARFVLFELLFLINWKRTICIFCVKIPVLDLYRCSHMTAYKSYFRHVIIDFIYRFLLSRSCVFLPVKSQVHLCCFVLQSSANAYGVLTYVSGK
jgi:hypothetical protein